MLKAVGAVRSPARSLLRPGNGRLPLLKKLLGFAARLAVAASMGCGHSPTNPTDVDFPVSSTQGNPGCTSTAPTIYMIVGLADHVVDPTAATLEARLRVGERVQLAVLAHGCGATNGVDTWSSTNPAAASVIPDRLTGFIADMTGVAPGQARVFATFKADDGKTYRTTLAYCPPVPDQKNTACANPRRIDVVTVVTQ